MELPENHRKNCCKCREHGRTKHWKLDEYYYTDFAQPWGADKLCEGCIEKYTREKGWLDPEADEAQEHYDASQDPEHAGQKKEVWFMHNVIQLEPEQSFFLP